MLWPLEDTVRESLARKPGVFCAGPKETGYFSRLKKFRLAAATLIESFYREDMLRPRIGFGMFTLRATSWNLCFCKPLSNVFCLAVFACPE